MTAAAPSREPNADNSLRNRRVKVGGPVHFRNQRGFFGRLKRVRKQWAQCPTADAAINHQWPPVDR
eukprot:9501274-Pyramimonas_sp.AAC.1